MARPLPEFSNIAAPLTDEEIRDRVDLAIALHVVEQVRARQSHLRAGKELGRAIFEGVTEILFTTVTDHGYVRFPGGYGSLKVQRLKRDPKPKRLPTGEVVPMPPNRVKLRYEEGAAVREALGMPPKTPYVRQFSRKSALSAKVKQALSAGKG